MSNDPYEYECMRAELLGLEKPDYEEFMRNYQDNEQKNVDEEEVDLATMKEIGEDEDDMKRVSGGLDELNSILRKTQSKINRIKDTCGSFTTSIKMKVGNKWGSQTSVDSDNLYCKPEGEGSSEQTLEESQDQIQNKAIKTDEADELKSSRKSDLAKALDTDLSRLDAMIEKAENAQYSMAHQSKQMKNALK